MRMRQNSNRFWPRILIYGAAAVALLVFGVTMTLSQENDCPNCDLSGAFFDEQDLSGAILTGATLYKASLFKTNLSGADMTGADLRGADLTGANLTDIQLIGADLTDASLEMADTTGSVTDPSTTCPDGSAGPCDF